MVQFLGLLEGAPMTQDKDGKKRDRPFGAQLNSSLLGQN